MADYEIIRKYGDLLGYSLKPPYTLSEIEEYEECLGNRLPEKLREYLLYVSREIIGPDCNINEFKLDLDIGTCTLPEDTREAPEDYEYSLKLPGSVLLGFICDAHYYSMVVRGTNFGTEWYHDDEFLQDCYRFYDELDFFDRLKKQAFDSLKE
jgi:hypothetical protein